MFEHLVIGLEGTALSGDERRRLREHPPLGVILFSRNLEDPRQVQRLLAEARQAAGRDLWAAIDEEGGRVSRMPWPPFDRRRPAADYGMLFRHDPEAARKAVFDDASQAGEALREIGFTHNCAPVLDLFHPDGDAIIGNRAFGADVAVVAALGRACMEGLHAAGIAAIGKHFPGHGRANGDSHLMLPQVDAPAEQLLAEADGFRQLFAAGLKHVMTAHVVYTQADVHAATFSPFWLRTVLRERFGFDGRVWSDDLCMKGAGDDPRQAARAALDAGCDVLLVCDPEGVSRFYR